MSRGLIRLFEYLRHRRDSQSTNDLKIEGFELHIVPHDVLFMTQLVKLSLARNFLKDLPDLICQLTGLISLNLDDNST